jgi:hypothetical protein
MIYGLHIMDCRFYRQYLSKSIQLNGETIPLSETLQLLGVLFDNHMTFRSHVTKISCKVTGFLRTLSTNRRNLPKQAKIMLVNAYVNSILTYCLPVFGHRAEIIDRFQKLQNFGIRTIYGLPKFCSVKVLRQQLGWFNISALYKYRLALATHKVIHGFAPAYLKLNLSSRAPEHDYHLRCQTLRQEVNADNCYLSESFNEKAIAIYNYFGGVIFAHGFSSFERIVRDILD